MSEAVPEPDTDLALPFSLECSVSQAERLKLILLAYPQRRTMGRTGFVFYHACMVVVMLCALILAMKARWPDGVIILMMTVIGSAIRIQWNSFRTHYRHPSSDLLTIKLTLTSDFITAFERGLELRSPWSEVRQVILCGPTAAIEMAPEAWVVVTEDKSQTPGVSMKDLASVFKAQGVKIRIVRP